MAKITTTRFDFAAVTPTGYPPVGSYIIGLDIADDKLKKMDSNGVLTIIGDGSGPDIFVSDTFANIDTLVTGNLLEPGAHYEITDPAGFPLGLLLSPGSLYYHTATLIIRATSVNTFDPVGILKANYVNQSLVESDAVIYSYNGSNSFANIKRRIDKRGNDIQGNINLFQWGNDNVIGNQVDSTSSLHIVDTSSFSENAGQVKWNTLKNSSTITAFTATVSSEIIENSLSNASLDLTLNSSQANYNNLTLGSSADVSQNSGTFSHNILEAQTSGSFTNNTSTISNNTFGTSNTITINNNIGTFIGNIFEGNYTLDASDLQGGIAGNNFGYNGQSTFTSFSGNFNFSSVTGSGLLDMGPYTEAISECQIKVNEYSFLGNMVNDNGDYIAFNKAELTLQTLGYVEKGTLQFTTEDDTVQYIKPFFMTDGQVAHLRLDAVATKGNGIFLQSFAQLIYDYSHSKMSGLSSGDIVLNMGNSNNNLYNYTNFEIEIDNGIYAILFKVAGHATIASFGVVNYTFTTTKFLSNA